MQNMPRGMEERANGLDVNSPDAIYRPPSCLSQPWTGICSRFIAVLLLHEAAVHLVNIAGLHSTAWLSIPVLWRAMNVTLLAFGITTATALRRGLPWAAWLLPLGVVLLQFVPCTGFYSLVHAGSGGRRDPQRSSWR